MQNARCPRCSKALPAAAAFCRRCGATLSPPPAATPSIGGGQWYRGVALALVVLGVAGAVLAWAVVASSPRSRTAVVSGRPWVPAPPRVATPSVDPRPALPPLPALPAWRRHVPADLAPPDPAAPEADRRGQMLIQGRFGSEPLAGAVFAGADLGQANFERADLRRADFRGANLSQTNLAGADLAGARLDGAMLGQAHFVSVDTAAVAGRTRVRDGITEPVPPPPLLARNAGRASFREARFSQTSLDGLDLAGADFAGASFMQVGFRRADLRGANLRGTRHQSSDFAGAELAGADLRGADLTGARNLTADQLAAALTDETTRRPRW